MSTRPSQKAPGLIRGFVIFWLVLSPYSTSTPAPLSAGLKHSAPPMAGFMTGQKHLDGLDVLRRHQTGDVDAGGDIAARQVPNDPRHTLYPK